MFEVRYIKDGNNVSHINVTPDQLLEILKAHLDGSIIINNVETSDHYSLNFELLIKNLKL